MKEILIAKIAVPTLIIGGLIGASYFGESYATDISDNPIIVSEKVVEANNIDNKPLQIVQRWQSKNIPGLSQLWGVNSKDEIIAGIGLSKDEFEKKYKDKKSEDIKTMTEYNKLNDNLYGKLYKVDLKSQKQSLLKYQGGYIQNKDVGDGIASDWKYINYDKNEKQYIYNLLDGKETMCNDSMNTKWSENGKYLIGYRENKIYLYDAKNNITKTIKIDENKVFVESGMYSEDGKEVYFIGEQVKKGNDDFRRDGIFKANIETNEIKEILLLPYRKTTDPSSKESSLSCDNYKILDGGKKIILCAIINGKSALYMYDVENKKFFTLVDTVETKHGSYGVSFSISPDGNKIAYSNKSKENADTNNGDLYVAKINGHRLTNIIIIDKNVNLGGSADREVLWGNNSKKIYFFKSNGDIDKNGNYISSENYINVVTLK
ncbi:hypothetical protein [Clostridium botulinum]|uniref:hypothetical protein n=1 Tax=Clostridium botulinum TaxID=1491 RepID=UPI0006A4017C|nr:hypothetical protein [Clostridium botulinum]KOC36674.1 hypothetical protein ADU81_00750 [Clostridium botulinum]NFF61014.1 hypothetical protein [Clostridium botulinum]NFL02459.1 hypothetical protein [Clostridium botulinum]